MRTRNPRNRSILAILDSFRRRLSVATAAAIFAGAAGAASAQRVDNPYVGARVYVNPEWAARAAAEPGGSAIANQPTAVWMDRIAAIGGVNGGMGLRDHLDEALRQAGGQPLVFQMVIYNLPGRDCAALASNGELGPTELPRYQQEYIDPIADILGDPVYANLRIVAVIEIDSLPNLVTNVTPRPTATAMCDVMRQNGNYVNGIGYALAQLGSLPNVYNYLDAAHHGWIGWDDNFGATAELMAQAATASGSTLASVTGFITSTANYGVLTEPFFTIDDVVNGQSVRENARWIDFNRYVDELSFAQAFRQRLIQAGFPSSIGMLIDTSRNGWGGPARPTGPGPMTTPDEYVNGGRLDRRIHLGNWCNQSGAGLGERPRAEPAPGIDAYVWIKPPGESDGSSSAIPNDEGKGFDRMCDPTYTGNPRNNNNLSGALPDAPLSGHWFPAQFQELLRNAFPPVADLPLPPEPAGSPEPELDRDSADRGAAGAGGCQAAPDIGGGTSASAGALLAALTALAWAGRPRRPGRRSRAGCWLALGPIGVLALIGCAPNQDGGRVSPEPPARAGPTVKGQTIQLPGGKGGAASKFVGNITTRGMVRPDFITFWNQITPENEGKWGAVEATRDVMDWTGLDAVHAYAREHGIPFKQHNFIWGSQQPGWIAGLSLAEQRAEVEEWIAAFCTRYPDVALIDVVNEPPPHTTPPYMEALGGAGATGYDWIITAFRMARQHCPDAILILNDYNVLRFDTDRFIGIVNAVKGSGFIDAIGEQAHGLETQPFAELETNLDKVLATGLPLYITEYDVDIADDTQQRNVLSQQFTLFWNTPQIRGITLWGYIVGSTWKQNTGLIRNGTPRPAMNWLMDFLGRSQTQSYTWRNVQIVGGGFVPGIIFNQREPGLVYARTDIGGAYRLDPATGRWIPLLDFLGFDDWNLTGVDSLATDPVDPDRLYVLAGTYTNEWTSQNGAILRSTDRGATWQRTDLPFKSGGNMPGRSMGERLAIDPNRNSTLYLGARSGNGLWRSSDFGATWSRVSSFTAVGTFVQQPGDVYLGDRVGVVWVVLDPATGTPGNATRTIYVGVADKGDSIYRSTDAGATWAAVPGQPTGFLPHHGILSSNGDLYVTYSDGCGPYDGQKGDVWKLATGTGVWTQISPVPSSSADDYFGYGGLAVDTQHPDTVMVAALNSWWPDTILFRSSDGGTTWTRIWDWASYPDRTLRYNQDISASPWLVFTDFNPVPPIPSPRLGWMVGDLEIDPFDSDRMLYGTGATIYGSDNLTAWDTGGSIDISVKAQGLEETAVLALISPPSGPPLISGLGDINGFRHDSLAAPPSRMFSQPSFAAQSLDYAELTPNFIVRSGNVDKATNPGVNRAGFSFDGGATWFQASSEPAGATGGGTIAAAANASRVVWAPAGTVPHFSTTNGSSWTASTGAPAGATVASDRVDPMRFYAFAGGAFYASTDGGASFTRSAAGGLPATGRITAVPDRERDVWLAGGTDGATYGLWHSTDGGSAFTRLANVEEADNIGLGRPAPGQTYPALYTSAQVDGVRGIYRSDDAGLTWVRITDTQHQFGSTGGAITGDPRVYGRVYVGTNGRGIVYGEP